MNNYIKTPDSFASLSAKLVIREFGDEVLDWEWEALWKSIHDRGIKLNDLGKVKIQSYLATSMNPIAVWEVNTFENIVLASNNVYPIPEITQDATPFELGWGLLELADYLYTQEIVLKHQKIKLGDDILCYIAACLKENGWLIAPRPLDFAQEELDRINENTSLKSKIMFEWGRIKGGDLQSTRIPIKDEVSVQLRRLRDFSIYLALKINSFRDHKKELNLE